MRNYLSENGLRPQRATYKDEPELQWLEDSINYLLSLSLWCAWELCAAVFRGVAQAYTTLQAQKK